MAKYGIADLAEKTGLEAHVVRMKLRQAGVEKNEEDGKYGWDTEKELKAVIAQVTGKAASKDADDKPAKKGKAKAEVEEKASKKAPKNKAAEAAPETKAKAGKVRPKPQGAKD